MNEEEIDNICERTKKGDANAMNEMGVLYHNGRGVDQSFSNAMAWYEEAADHDNSDAWVNIGILYDFGHGADVNYNHVTSMFIRAASLGNEWAIKNIFFQSKVKGTNPDFKEVMAWFKEAAELGDAGAMYYVGLLYEVREEEEWDRKEAITWYKKAADLGNADAMYRLGYIHEDGLFTGKRDFFEEAMKWYKKAADLGNADAIWRIGINIYSKEKKHEEAMKWFRKTADPDAVDEICGDDTDDRPEEMPYEEAMSWFRKAAEQGNTNAMVTMGVFSSMLHEAGPYVNEHISWKVPSGHINERRSYVRVGSSSYGTGRKGTEESYKEAMSWFRKAADLGNTWAMLNISTVYYFGVGVERDYREATTWIRKAMDLNNFYHISTSLGYIRNDYRKVELSDDWKTIIHMGVIEFNDQGTEQSYKDAMSWFRKAADLGSASAMNNIGIIYECGLGTEQDYKEAMQWYRKSADLGNTLAMLNLSLLYFNGWGVEKDYFEAMSWYRKAVYSGTV